MNPKTTIVGRIGGDPEKIGSGIRFRVATKDRVKNADTGQWEDKDTSWWTVKAWKSLAEQANGLLKKGQEVIIYGTIKEDSWTDSTGNKRVSSEVVADNIGITTHTLSKADVMKMTNTVTTSPNGSTWE